jgi:uncharacterized membrane protein YqiK
MNKGWLIVIIVLVILLVGVVFFFFGVHQQGGFAPSEVDFSSGTKFLSSIGDSTKSNAFEGVETNPFRYKNG